jgi:hypothetical protein
MSLKPLSYEHQCHGLDKALKLFPRFNCYSSISFSINIDINGMNGIDDRYFGDEANQTS